MPGTLRQLEQRFSLSLHENHETDCEETEETIHCAKFCKALRPSDPCHVELNLLHVRCQFQWRQEQHKLPALECGRTSAGD
jgi:hypothetical protein